MNFPPAVRGILELIIFMCCSDPLRSPQGSRRKERSMGPGRAALSKWEQAVGTKHASLPEVCSYNQTDQRESPIQPQNNDTVRRDTRHKNAGWVHRASLPLCVVESCLSILLLGFSNTSLASSQEEKGW